MACNAINSWTFAGLVGAFLDLSIAYLLLCASALAYLYSKILGLFGLALPCPCDGLFGHVENKNCFQAMLVNDPSLKISSVQSSVKKKVPFDSIWNNSDGDDGGDEDEDEEQRESRSNLDKWRSGSVEMEGEASSSSWNEKKNFVGLKKGSSVPIPKWKGVGSQRPSVGLKRRKRAAASCHRGKLSSSWYGPSVPTTASTGLSYSASAGKFGSDINEESATTVNSEDGRESSKEIGLTEQDFHGFGRDGGSFPKNKSIDKELGMAEIQCLPPDQDLDGNDKYAIRILEKALEEEHAACTGLYHELEKERTAAATAADEALAMILRLQEEKATIEMEARQYQRMIEEKSAYDAEEMNILKEILVRREMEKHFLEKEVEAYKQMLTEKEQLDADMYDIAATQEQMPSNEEPQQTSKSVGDTKINSDFSEYELTPMKSPNHTLAFEKELPIPKLNEDAGSLHSSIENNCVVLSRRDDGINQEFQEKGMTSDSKNLNDKERYVQYNQSTTPQGSDLHKKAFNLAAEEEEQNMTPKITKACDETKIIFPYNNENMGKQGEDLHGSDSGADYHVHDIHVIYDEAKTNNEESGNKSGKKASGFVSNLPRTCNSPIIGGLEIEPKRKSNSSDRSGRLPPIGPSRGKTLPPISRRNSMSAFDYEKLKIDSEVGWLRERLKIVQQGREKLNLPAGPREREQVQLQMLENIACQLREIRQLTEPGKVLRRASLPPPSSKVMPRRRHSLGASSGLLRSI